MVLYEVLLEEIPEGRNVRPTSTQTSQPPWVSFSFHIPFSYLNK